MRDWWWLAVALACPMAQPVQARQDVTEARAAYNQGRYDEAISRFRGLVKRHPSSVESARGLVRALSEVGRYNDAEGAARRFIDHNSGSPELWNQLGKVLALGGRRAAAESAFATAITAGASDSLPARLNLTILRYRRGEVAEAMRAFDEFIDIYNQNPQRPSEELTAVATAVRYLGVDDHQLYQDALRAYDEAIVADPDNLEPQVLVGELFLEKYRGTDARETFDRILARNPSHPRALLGLARTMRFGGSPEALEQARRAIKVNPNFVAARVFLATHHVELEDYDSAAREVERALDVSPTALEPLAVLAAIRFLQGDHVGFGEARRRALSLNPAYGELFITLAEVSARNRLYHDAAGFARRAVELDPRSWRGFGLLGVNQLRVGQVEEGRANLEIAFEGDPYNPWTKNTLDLLDTLATYRETVSDRFRFFIDGKESELLSAYMTSIAEEAYDRLAQRYRYQPATPIRVEVYPSHGDFSVRTVGLVGIGALGVSFGPVIAMDSPSARELGSFNWGSTLWHEIAHTFHLGMTGHKVPRWFAEGLAVFEERHARPGWGDDVSPEFLFAFKAGRLRAVSELNAGFVRPAYPEQVMFSYYQASLVCELIERDHGFQVLVRILHGYRAGKSTAEVFRAILGTDLKSFDKIFDGYLRERFAVPLAALRSPERSTLQGDIAKLADSEPDDFTVQLAVGQALVHRGRPQDAVPFLRRAKSLFPQYAGPGSPYWALAQIYMEVGAVREAADELRALTAINARHYDAFIELAGLLERLSDKNGAADALDRALYVYPHEMATHRRLAALSAELGNWERAVRERRAVVALDPVDQAEALYQLALAYLGAGDRVNARSTVLRALEHAPNFEQAQDLLLQLYVQRNPG